MALAAQAYAKAELLWYFRHVGDKLPPSPTTPAASKLTGQLLGQQPKQPQLADDGHVVILVAAAAAIYDLLVRHCTSCHYHHLIPVHYMHGAQFTSQPSSNMHPLSAARTAVVDKGEDRARTSQPRGVTCGCLCLQEEHQDLLQGQQLAAMRALLEQQVLPETAAVLATADKNAREIPSTGKERVVPKILVPLVKVWQKSEQRLYDCFLLAAVWCQTLAVLCQTHSSGPRHFLHPPFICRLLQAVVYPLAELTQAEDVAAPKADEGSRQQPQQPARHPAADSGDTAAGETAEEANADDSGTLPYADLAQADDSNDPAAVLCVVQQHMVHLTMLLCSRNLWMRPAVLEAPAQDPQYLEAIHKVGHTQPMTARAVVRHKAVVSSGCNCIVSSVLTCCALT